MQGTHLQHGIGVLICRMLKPHLLRFEVQLHIRHGGHWHARPEGVQLLLGLGRARLLHASLGRRCRRLC